MSNAQAILLCVAVAFAVAHGFTSSLNQINVQSQCKKPSTRSNMVMKWPGDRPPKTNPKRKELLMDASWARADERVDVFEDKPNPTYPWWETYFPTEEEIEAAAQGYDFENPEKWLAENKKVVVSSSKAAAPSVGKQQQGGEKKEEKKPWYQVW